MNFVTVFSLFWTLTIISGSVSVAPTTATDPVQLKPTNSSTEFEDLLLSSTEKKHELDSSEDINKDESIMKCYDGLVCGDNLPKDKACTEVFKNKPDISPKFMKICARTWKCRRVEEKGWNAKGDKYVMVQMEGCAFKKEKNKCGPISPEHLAEKRKEAVEKGERIESVTTCICSGHLCNGSQLQFNSPKILLTFTNLIIIAIKNNIL